MAARERPFRKLVSEETSFEVADIPDASYVQVTSCIPRFVIVLQYLSKWRQPPFGKQFLLILYSV